MKCGKDDATTKKYALIYDAKEHNFPILALISLGVCRGCIIKTTLGNCFKEIMFAIIGLVVVIVLSVVLSAFNVLWWGALILVGGGFIALVQGIYGEIKYNKNYGHMKVMWKIFEKQGVVPHHVVYAINWDFVPPSGDILLTGTDKYDPKKIMPVDEDTAGGDLTDKVRLALSTSQIIKEEVIQREIIEEAHQ